MHPNAWFCLLPAHGRLPGDIPKLFPPPGIHEEGRIPPHAWGSLSIIRRRLSREKAVHWPPKRCFDKMSNEGLHSAFPRTKIRLGGFRGPSQAICKIHIDTNSLQALSSRHNLKATSFPYDIRIPTRHTWWNLPIYWHASHSSERNPEFLPFILRIFDFHGWNNIVWEVKLYCLTRQTLVFRMWNNIVWASKCKYFENEMYSFLK